MFTALFGFLASSAGGGIIGGGFALIKQIIEGRTLIATKELDNKKEVLRQAEAQRDREHEVLMLQEQTKSKSKIVEVKTEAKVELETMQSRGMNVIEEFKGLKTSSKMDNYRASVRPTVAYWALLMFNLSLGYCFWRYGHLIPEETGLAILLGLVSTLNFMITSVISFYYVSRPNHKPKL